MKLTIIAVGVRMPKWVDTAWLEYARRLPPDFSLNLHEIKPEPRTSGKTAAQMMLAEARRIESVIPGHAFKIALDEHGRDWTTLDLAQGLETWRAHGHDVVFLVGGPDGLDPDLKKNCNLLVRLSSLTLPHAMVRVILAEQLYRAWSIMSNHPYHRA